MRALYPNSATMRAYRAIQPLRTVRRPACAAPSGRPHAPPDGPAERSTRFKSAAPALNLWRGWAGQGRAEGPRCL